jgi:hypothetical protein
VVMTSSVPLFYRCQLVRRTLMKRVIKAR